MFLCESVLCVLTPVLLTTENYPDIMLPALHHNQGLCLVYFLSYFMFVVWMIMSLFLAIVFKNYKDIHTYKVVKAHVSERRSLLTAFLILQVRANTHRVDCNTPLHIL